MMGKEKKKRKAKRRWREEVPLHQKTEERGTCLSSKTSRGRGPKKKCRCRWSGNWIISICPFERCRFKICISQMINKLNVNLINRFFFIFFYIFCVFYVCSGVGDTLSFSGLKMARIIHEPCSFVVYEGFMDGLQAILMPENIITLML